MENNTSVCSLTNAQCKPCSGEGEAFSATQIEGYLKQIHPEWELSKEGETNHISRLFKFKGYAKAISFANAVGWIANQQGHHPDICFGWGYCKVIFTTHELNGLSENDFICAAKVDNLMID